MLRSSQNISVNSKLEISVWKRSESKKRGRKRQLAASTSLTFGELLDKSSASPRKIPRRLVRTVSITV